MELLASSAAGLVRASDVLVSQSAEVCTSWVTQILASLLYKEEPKFCEGRGLLPPAHPARQV